MGAPYPARWGGGSSKLGGHEDPRRSSFLPCEVLGMNKRAVDARLEETLAIVPELDAMLPRSGAARSGGQGKMAALERGELQRADAATALAH